MLKLHGYFTDGAILQRGKPVNVTGEAEGDLCLLLAGGEYREERRVRANGRFFVAFPPSEDAESEFVLTALCGGERREVRLRFGDVYLMLGQSNMSYALGAAEGCGEWQTRAQNAKIAVLDVAEDPSAPPDGVRRPPLPLGDFIRPLVWVGEGDFSHLSALSVMTATLLSEERHIPVGAVHTAMGGLAVEAYLKRETAEADGETVRFLKKSCRYVSPEDYNRMGERNFTQLSGVWNEKISPLLPFSFAGIVWYLGESSAFDEEYARAFLRQLKLIAGDLFSAFGEIPFVAVHIAPEFYPYGDGYGYLYINEALTDFEEFSPHIVTVPIYDVEPRWLKQDGELYYHPIHPVNKAPVAGRIARALSEGERYPRIRSVRFEKGRAVCKIACGGIAGGALRGFTVAGGNGKYYPAAAEAIGGDEIAVSSPEVPSPAAVTYAFMQYQDFCNAKDGAGRPLLPYRSERGPVSRGYFFPPAFTVEGAEEVYENNFGWRVGTCKRRKVWKKGEIYDASDVSVSAKGGAVVIEARPEPSEYYLFGVSPALLMSGHRRHMEDFRYWNFSLSSSGETEFLGVVVRCADGAVYRLDLCGGGKLLESAPLHTAPRRFAVSLTRGTRGDSAPVRLSARTRALIVQAEFLFRARSPVTVTLTRPSYSDRDLSEEGESSRAEETRGDINLPKRP